MKDDATLNYLENQYRFFSLEKAKKEKMGPRN